MWFVYILRCADDSLYTGVTTDINRRLRQHNGLLGSGARYTRRKRPVVCVYKEAAATRGTAQIREHAIKQLSRAAKDLLIATQKE